VQKEGHGYKEIFQKDFQIFRHIPIEMEDAHSHKPAVISSDDDNCTGSCDGSDDYDTSDDDLVWVGPNGEDWCYDPNSDHHYDLLLNLKDETTDLPSDYKSLHTLIKVYSVTSKILSITHMRLSCYDHWENDLKIHFQTGI
jgi:hypothetical protein